MRKCELLEKNVGNNVISGSKFEFQKERQNGFTGSIFEEMCFSAKLGIEPNEKIKDEKNL